MQEMPETWWRDSRVTTGNSDFLLCWPREVQSSIRVARESWGLHLSQCRTKKTSFRLVSMTEFSSTGATRISGSHSRLTRGKASSRGETKYSALLSSSDRYLLEPPDAAAKSLQSCPSLCDPLDGSQSGSSIHWIFQARAQGSPIIHSSWEGELGIALESMQDKKDLILACVQDLMFLSRGDRDLGVAYQQPTPVFFLENPRDRGAWWAAIAGVAQSRTSTLGQP